MTREADRRREEGLLGLEAAVALADELLALVDRDAPEVAHSRDRNDQILWLGLARGYRCLRSIRDLVAQHQEADDALILSRALVSIALRSLWLAAAAESDERVRRGRVFTRDSYRRQSVQARELAAFGFPVEMSAAEWSALDEIDVAGDIPNDVSLAREFGFEEIYAAVYRTASGSSHFSLASALEGFDVGDGEVEDLSGLRIRFRDGQPDRAASALVQACVLYAAFLESSEPLVHHGLFKRAKDTLARRFPEAFSEEPSG